MTTRPAALEAKWRDAAARPVRITPLRNHRPLFIRDPGFWPRRDQLGPFTWLVIFNAGLYGALAFSILTRHHG